MLKIEGIATIGKGSFRFDSGLPSNEPTVEAQTILGKLCISENACAELHQDGRAMNLPPDITTVGEGDGYKIKRTNKNYILHVKVPIMESSADTEERLRTLLPVVQSNIIQDRKEIYKMLVA